MLKKKLEKASNYDDLTLHTKGFMYDSLIFRFKEYQSKAFYLDVQDYKFCLSHPELTVGQLEQYKKCITLDMNPAEIGVLPVAKLEAQFNAQLEKTYNKATTTLPDFITMERIQQFKKRR